MAPWQAGRPAERLARAFGAEYGPRESANQPLATAGLAQLVEHLICNQGVVGSNPASGTNIFKYLTHFRAR